MRTTEARVKREIAMLLGFPEEQITAPQTLGEDLGADSLDTVELWLALEEEFEIAIPDEEAEELRTVGQVIDYVAKKVPA